MLVIGHVYTHDLHHFSDVAFELVMTDVLQATLGDRPDAPNVVLHITDGISGNQGMTYYRMDVIKGMPYQVHFNYCHVLLFRI